MIVIGLSGGIGSGKSKVAAYLQSLGAQVIEADKIGHQIMEPGTEGYRRIVAAFGPEILARPAVAGYSGVAAGFSDTVADAANTKVNPSSAAATAVVDPIDRSRLGAIVFAEPAKLALLNAISHPLIRQRIAAIIEELRRQEAAQERARAGDSANAAQGSANEAGDSANVVQVSANGAGDSANAAQVSANRAGDSANAAQVSANRADDSANAAQVSANGAGDSANAAQERARAGDSADAAQESANGVTNSANAVQESLNSAPIRDRGIVVIEAALFAELQLANCCDAIWLVTAAPETRIERLQHSRGLSREQIAARIAAQQSEAEMRRSATAVIDNNGDFTATQNQVDHLLGNMLMKGRFI